MQAFSTLFAQEPTEMKAIPKFLAQAMQLRNEENDKKLTNVGKELLGWVASLRDVKVASLREIRKQEKSAQADLASFQRAATYFEHTGNFGPLSQFMDRCEVRRRCAELGVMVPTDEEKKVPDEWQPPTVTS